MVGLADFLTDPYAIGAIIAGVIHFVQYYALLEKISNKITNNKDNEIQSILKSLGKKYDAKKVIIAHHTIHQIEEYYSSLNSKVISNFQTGWVIIVLLGIAAARHYLSFINDSLISIISFFIIAAGANWALTLYALLKWNIERNGQTSPKQQMVFKK